MSRNKKKSNNTIQSQHYNQDFIELERKNSQLFSTGVLPN
jgi:hypothetical protein